MTRLTRPDHVSSPRLLKTAPRKRRSLVSALDDVHSQAGFGTGWHRAPTYTLLAAIVCLALLNFLSTSPVLAWLVAMEAVELPTEWTSVYLAGCRVLCYFVLPAAVG